MENTLEKLLQTKPMLVVETASKRIFEVIEVEITRVRAAPPENIMTETMKLSNRVVEFVISNLSIIDMALVELDVDIDKLEKITNENELIKAIKSSENLRVKMEALDGRVTEFLDLFHVRLIEQQMRIYDCPLLAFGGTTAMTLIEMLLKAPKLVQLGDHGIIPQIILKLRQIASSKLPHDPLIAVPMPTERDKVFLRRDAGSKMLWVFETALRLIINIPAEETDARDEVLFICNVLSGVIFSRPTFVEGVEDDEGREHQRRQRMLPEVISTRMPCARFAVEPVTKFYTILKMAGLVEVIQKPPKLPVRPNTKEMRHLDTRLRKMEITSEIHLNIFWNKFVSYAMGNVPGQGEHQWFQRFLFGLVIPPGGSKAVATNHPLRQRHQMNEAKEAAHPTDFMTLIFISGGKHMGLQKLISTYLTLRTLVQKHLSSPEILSSPENYFKARAELYDVQIKERAEGDPIRMIMENAPDSFIPDGLLHRRSVIMATLFIISSILDRADIQEFVQNMYINEPTDQGILNQTGTVVRIFGDLAMVTNTSTVATIPDQCPMRYLAAYLGVLLLWSTNTRAHPIIVALCQTLKSIQV